MKCIHHKAINRATIAVKREQPGYTPLRYLKDERRVQRMENSDRQAGRVAVYRLNRGNFKVYCSLRKQFLRYDLPF